MANKTRWLLIILVAIAGHFMDGWSYPPHTTELGWWLWHAVNWARRDIVLIVLLWPMIHFYRGQYYYKGWIWLKQSEPRFDRSEKIALWTLAAVFNFMLHHALYWLAENTRSILQ